MKIFGLYDLKEKEQCIEYGEAFEIVKFLSLV